VLALRQRQLFRPARALAMEPTLALKTWLKPVVLMTSGQGDTCGVKRLETMAHSIDRNHL